MIYLLLFIVFGVACYIATVVWQRLLNTQEKLANLQDDLRRNDLKLANEMDKLQNRLPAEKPPENTDEA